ncbi:MAG: toprim domain-containing protein [Planctomycetota bacterium]|jgi:DNA primase
MDKQTNDALRASIPQILPPNRLVVTRGVMEFGHKDVYEVWQSGFQNVTALMGASMSNEQANLILEALNPNGQLTLMLDPDEAGAGATKEIIAKLIDKLYIRVIDLEEGLQPDELSKEKIQELLSQGRKEAKPCFT